jgi:uncharacterized protein HemY
MYLKMTLSDQLIEERFVQPSNLYKGDYLQLQIEEMITLYEQEIENSGEQPQFLLAQKATKKEKEKPVVSFLGKLTFLHKLFGQ